MGTLIGEAGNDYAESLERSARPAPRRALQHSPAASTLIVLPLGTLGFEAAARAWIAASLAALAGLAWILTVTAFGAQRPIPIQVAGVFVLLVLWPPVLHNLEKGRSGRSCSRC